MAERREPIEPGDVVGCRIFFADGNTWIIECDHIEINRLVDEVIIFEGQAIKARFNINKIAGHQIIRASEKPDISTLYEKFKMSCGED